MKQVLKRLSAADPLVLDGPTWLYLDSDMGTTERDCVDLEIESSIDVVLGLIPDASDYNSHVDPVLPVAQTPEEVNTPSSAVGHPQPCAAAANPTGGDRQHLTIAQSFLKQDNSGSDLDRLQDSTHLSTAASSSGEEISVTPGSKRSSRFRCKGQRWRVFECGESHPDAEGVKSSGAKNSVFDGAVIGGFRSAGTENPLNGCNNVDENDCVVVNDEYGKELYRVTTNTSSSPNGISWNKRRLVLVAIAASDAELNLDEEAAILDELAQLDLYDVFESVDIRRLSLSGIQRAIPTVMLVSPKIGPDGKLKKYKGRFVIKGCLDRGNPGETESPTVS